LSSDGKRENESSGNHPIAIPIPNPVPANLSLKEKKDPKQHLLTSS
jgi:hypothetical protein